MIILLFFIQCFTLLRKSNYYCIVCMEPPKLLSPPLPNVAQNLQVFDLFLNFTSQKTFVDS